MIDAVAPELIAFHEMWDYSVVAVNVRLVLVGEHARAALARDPRMWSAVMIEKPLREDA
jgi:hypothetical protein